MFVVGTRVPDFMLTDLIDQNVAYIKGRMCGPQQTPMDNNNTTTLTPQEKYFTILGAFIFLSDEEYNCDIFLSTGTDEYIIN
jgi:hypothetical protein